MFTIIIFMIIFDKLEIRGSIEIATQTNLNIPNI